MFANKGRPRVYIEMIGPGYLVTSPDRRLFSTMNLNDNKITSKLSNSIGEAYWDIDEQGAPSSAGSDFTINSVPVFTTRKTIIQAGHSNAGMLYLGTSISPLTRRYRYEITRPELFSGIETINSGINGTYSATSNVATVMNVDFRQFKNVQYLVIAKCWFTTLPHLPEKMDRVEIHSNTILTTFQSFPIELRRFAMYSITSQININSKLNLLTKCKEFVLASFSGINTSYGTRAINLGSSVGSLNLTNITDLEQIQVSSGTSVTYPSLTSVRNFLVVNQTMTLTNVTELFENGIWESIYLIQSSGAVLTDYLDSSVLPSSATELNLDRSTLINGDVSFTTLNNTLLYLTLGFSSPSTNTWGNIDLSGLTGLRVLNIANVLVTGTLIFPTNTNLVNITLANSSLVLTPSNKTYLQSCTSLTTLDLLGCNVASWSTNLDLSNNLVTSMFGLRLSGLSHSGILTLPPACVNYTQSLHLDNNSYTFVVIPNNVFVLSLSLKTMPLLVNFDFTKFTSISTIDINNVGLSTIVLTSFNGTNKTLWQIQNNTNLLQIDLPTVSFTLSQLTSAPLRISGNPLLTTINNLSNVTYSTSTGTRTLSINGNSLLNMEFPIGVTNLLPHVMTFSGNAMSTANVDATIFNAYNNRTKWTALPIPITNPSLNLSGGTNGVPSGIYQNPGGVPTTAKEAMWLLVNNHGWTITTN